MKKLFNKLGMTYVEMLVALALLSLIVVSFTPMLVSSYETIYTAGERVQKNYGSRTEIEEGLARRDSSTVIDMNMDLRVNADTLFNNINVNGRKVVSTFASVFETVFGQIRPRVEIVSPSTVYDNQPSHDIILQTTGLEYSKIRFGKFASEYTIPEDGKSPLPEGTIYIQVTMPDKTRGSETNTGSSSDSGASNEEPVYDYGTVLNVSLASENSNDFTSVSGSINFSNKDNNGRFKLRIGNPSLDFTYSPVQVKVYYTNPRGKIRFVTDYLYIEPATMIFAGETSAFIDYYTSPGVEEIDTSTDENNRTSRFELKATARQMRTTNSPYLRNSGAYTGTPMGAPGDHKVNTNGHGVRIQAVKWIDNDETPGLKPYYVMVGTDGAIYRMYNFTSNKTDIYEYSTGHKIYDTSTGYFGASQPYIDNVYNISNGARIYPAFWGGDFTHTFEYTSAQRRVAYGTSINNYPGAGNFTNTNGDSDQTWVTSATDTITYDGKQHTVEMAGLRGADKYNIMSPVAQYVYYYNGGGTFHTFPSKNHRVISYILTERGYPLRLFGVVKDGGIFNGSSDKFQEFYDIWDKSNKVPLSTENNYWESGSSDTTHPWKNQIYCFRYKDPDEYTQNDYTITPIRIKALASYDTKKITTDDVNYLHPGEDNNYTTSMQKLPNTVNKDMLGGQSYDVSISDVVYIPGTDNTTGNTFYVGSVSAYCNVVQTNRVSDARAYKRKDHGKDGGYKNHQDFWGNNRNCYPSGTTTDYLIFTDDESKSTYIAKYDDVERDVNSNYGFWNSSWGTRRDQLNFCTDYVRQNCVNINNSNCESLGLIDGSNPTKRAEFYFPTLDANWKYLYLEDTKFTLGFASDRERVYHNITYDGETEFVRSFERLYWRSHYGQDAYGASAQDSFTGNALSIHSQNRMVCNRDGVIIKSGSSDYDAGYGYQYLNSPENDYYNVWFPGEMYNLTKVVSKDGVTVAVGYSVVGSAYQYINPGASKRTSTALGGIYNDGVLSAMIEGQDDAFVNLLYFKDNDTFDGTSYNNKKFYTKDDTTYGVYSSYGTHARDSVQFIAVDLVVEAQNANIRSSTSQLSYYAYYGDSKGRVFRSLVATGTGTVSDQLDENGDPVVTKAIELVPFIKDNSTTISGKYTVGGVETDYAGMEEIKVGGKSLSAYFSKIGTIDAKDDMIIITGEAATKGAVEIIIVGIRNPDTGNWEYHAVQNDNFTGIINDASIIGGYYYITGSGGGTSKPWIAAVAIDTLKDVAQTTKKINASPNGSHSTSKDHLLWIEVDNELYAIAGRDTN